MNNIIYIFLDIDGVLNNENYIKECYERNGHHAMHMNHVPFDPKCLNNLMILCQEIEKLGYAVQIILSSTWRLHEIDYEIVNARLAEYGLSLKDKTPYISGNRGKEILDFLKNHNNYIDYIILDDDAFDILELHPNKLIRTSFKTGLTGSEVSLALTSIMELYYG